jgi:anti-anti-sigma factor
VPNDPHARRPAFEAAMASDGRVYVAISGDLDVTTVAALAEHLAVLADVRPTRLVINLSEVGFLDCAAARLLASTATFLAPGQRPVLTSLRPAVWRILHLTDMAAGFDIAD